METLYVMALALLTVAAFASVVAAVRAPSFPDRIVALDMLLVVIVSGLGVQAAATGSSYYLDVMVVAALLGFTGTSLVARFVERKGSR